MLLYDLLFLLLFILAAPIMAMRGKLYSGYIQRLGFIHRLKQCDSSIWLHAVSVGEILSAKELIRELRKEFAQTPIIITTITQTGNKIAQGLATAQDVVTYLPLDVSFIIRRFIRRFNPRIFIALETEIWPNLITQLSAARVPMVILNGRISEKSFRKYRVFTPFLKLVVGKIACLAMQSKDYADKIISLGARVESVVVSGNMKFDVQTAALAVKGAQMIRSQLSLGQGNKLFVAGCTHKGEEKIILSVYKRLSRELSDMRLLIAPRHIERIRELEGEVRNFGFKPVRVSKISSSGLDEKTVYLLDVMGSLRDYYEASFCSFVGGSLVPFGGHNILEPAFFAKPIIFGKFMHNFSDIRDLFLENNAGIEVKSPAELEQGLRSIFKDGVFAANLGLKAREVVNNNKGATLRNMDLVRDTLNSYEKLSL